MRFGFTTGSCAAAAAGAACFMLLSGRGIDEITIDTPKGIKYTAALYDIIKDEKKVSCAVKKDAGDDPDVTDGMLIYAAVSFLGDEDNDSNGAQKVIIEGGEGVGRVMLPGLDRPVGDAAINSVPRRMITEEIKKICRQFDYRGAVRVLIYAPEGERIAGQTFNPRLGIRGGISILGTTGIVEPMSNEALIETIRLEIEQKAALGYSMLVIAPGNYGADFLKKKYGLSSDDYVLCSNFVGLTVDMAVSAGIKNILFTGHMGKLIKVAGGIMNTHSRESDCRCELMSAFAIRAGAEDGISNALLDASTTEEAAEMMEEAGILREACNIAVERIKFYLEKRAENKLNAECIMFSNVYGELGKTYGAEEWFTLWERERERSI